MVVSDRIVFLAFIFILVITFGEPDLLDAVIHFLMK